MIVTGASRGFGRCVAEEFARQVAPVDPVDFILIARSENGLRTAAASIGDITKSIPDAAEVVVRREVMDLGDMERLETRLEEVFRGLGECGRCTILSHARLYACFVFDRTSVQLGK